MADASKHSELLSAQARYAQRAAEACGYAFRSLDGDDGYLFEVRDGERRAGERRPGPRRADREPPRGRGDDADQCERRNG